MSVSLKVPRDQVSGLASLRDLAVEKLSTLFETLRDAEPILRIADLDRILAKAFEESAVRGVRQVLISLVHLKRHREFGDADLWDALSAALSREPAAWSAENLSAWSARRAHIVGIISCRPLEVLEKLLDVSFEHAAIMKSVRIFTDLRPVFDEAGGEILAAVVSHNLRLSYAEDKASGRNHTVSIALDADDLRELAAACERAAKKGAVLGARMKSTAAIPTLILGDDANE